MDRMMILIVFFLGCLLIVAAIIALFKRMGSGRG
jgi:hypothetical protein